MPPEPVICSVITKSHLGFARALVHSFRRWHPTGRAYVLVVDDPEGCYDPGEEDFTVVALADLRLRDPRGFCFRYHAFALCNALKPYLLLHLLRERQESRILYLDSDIGVFGDLQPLFGTLESAEVLLTPHTLVDYPDDGAWPSRSVLLTSGTYNAGVIGVRDSAESVRFLEWWAALLEFGCLDDPVHGLFVDQRYLDLVPVLFQGVHVMRHEGVNVAHFNLHHRRLRREGGRWFVNEVPLLLFHFTQMDWAQPGFDARMTRPLLASQPLLRELFVEFREELIRAEYERTKCWPNTYDRFANGLVLTRETRAVFLEKTRTAAASADPFADPRWIGAQRQENRRRAWQRWRALPGRIWRRFMGS
ncbi:MAG TPA: hypothetical protein VMB21_10740 [Candidatus Limnocylindria bacterium]|nr:hypothetical protein [Candidatus Limnocylindria bacterium]